MSRFVLCQACLEVNPLLVTVVHTQHQKKKKSYSLITTFQDPPLYHPHLHSLCFFIIVNHLQSAVRQLSVLWTIGCASREGGACADTSSERTSAAGKLLSDSPSPSPCRSLCLSFPTQKHRLQQSSGPVGFFPPHTETAETPEGHQPAAEVVYGCSAEEDLACELLTP